MYIRIPHTVIDYSDSLESSCNDLEEHLTEMEYSTSKKFTAESRTRNSRISEWDEYYAALFLYREKERSADFNVPLDYVLEKTCEVTSDVVRRLYLGRWLAEQKELYLQTCCGETCQVLSSYSKRRAFSKVRRALLFQLVEAGLLWCN
jgi:hypothetical protein